MLKYSVSAALLLLTSFAGPLEKTKIASDAQWYLHLDLDAFRSSALGAHVLKDVLDPKLKSDERLKKLNLSLSPENISSVTAYGSSFEKNGDAVLLLSTTADVKKDLDTLAGMAALSGATNSPLKTVHQQPYWLYSFKDEVFIAPSIAHTVVVAKSKDQIERARKVLLGESENFMKSTRFADYPDAPKNSFLCAAADGFTTKAPIPPQAQVLKEARGARLALGEREKNLFVNVVFKGKDEEATTKIQQVLQGLVALVSLSQQSSDATELANNTKIASEKQNVLINLEFPVAKAIERLDESALGGNSDAHPAHKMKKHHKKHTADADAKPAPAPDNDAEKADKQ